MARPVQEKDVEIIVCKVPRELAEKIREGYSLGYSLVGPVTMGLSHVGVPLYVATMEKVEVSG